MGYPYSSGTWEPSFFPACLGCGQPISPRPTESRWEFEHRRYHDHTCANAWRKLPPEKRAARLAAKQRRKRERRRQRERAVAAEQTLRRLAEAPPVVVETKICEGCGYTFYRHAKEPPKDWAERRFCSIRCSVRHTPRTRTRMEPVCRCGLPKRPDEDICRLCQREHLRPTADYPSRRLVRDLVAGPVHDGYDALVECVFQEKDAPSGGGSLKEKRSWLDDLLDEIAPLKRGEEEVA